MAKIFKTGKKRLFLMIFGVAVLAAGFWLIQSPKAEAGCECRMGSGVCDSNVCYWDDTTFGVNHKICVINNPSECDTSDGGASCSSGSGATAKYCMQDKCPTLSAGSLDGKPCQIGAGAAGSCVSQNTGMWDDSNSKCITCSGKIENKVCGDASGIYSDPDEGCTKVDTANTCEIACNSSVASQCDDKVAGNFFGSCFKCTASANSSSCKEACTSECNYKNALCSAGCGAGVSTYCDAKAVGATCDTGKKCNAECQCVAPAVKALNLDISPDPPSVAPSGNSTVTFTVKKTDDGSIFTDAVGAAVTISAPSCVGGSFSPSPPSNTNASGITTSTFTAPGTANVCTFSATAKLAGGYADGTANSSIAVSACPSDNLSKYERYRYVKGQTLKFINFWKSNTELNDRCLLCIYNPSGTLKTSAVKETCAYGCGGGGCARNITYISDATGTWKGLGVPDSGSCPSFDPTKGCAGTTEVVECEQDSDCASGDCNESTYTCRAPSYPACTPSACQGPVTNAPNCLCGAALAGLPGLYCCADFNFYNDLATCITYPGCGGSVCNGNGTCDAGENGINCAADCCKAGDGCPLGCANPPDPECPVGACNNNNVIDIIGEQCDDPDGDGIDLGGKTCATLPGFTGGILACKADCTFNTSGCTGGGPGPSCSAGDGCVSNCSPPDPDCGLINPLGCKDIVCLIERVITIISYIAFAIIIVMILIAAFLFMTAAGEAQKISAARAVILYALIGLLVIILARGLIAALKYALGGR